MRFEYRRVEELCFSERLLVGTESQWWVEEIGGDDIPIAICETREDAARITDALNARRLKYATP